MTAQIQVRASPPARTGVAMTTVSVRSRYSTVASNVAAGRSESAFQHLVQVL
ncbi:hypothetical protein [Dactylosporangium sp. CA-139066]|uniref:hypothetical protein n=1 Tax=Dactylosporangium sp. CA-139066 TaxID=3239930 RepID=UPI003D920766